MGKEEDEGRRVMGFGVSVLADENEKRERKGQVEGKGENEKKETEEGRSV